MRVLMVTSFPIPGEYDGTAMLPIKILRALKPRGVDVVVAYLRLRPPRGSKAAATEFEGTPVFTIPPAGWTSGAGLKQIARELPFDVVHAQHYGGATRAYFACRHNGWPMVYEIHSLLGDEVERDRLGRGLVFRTYLALEQRVCRHAAQIIALGEPVKQVVVDGEGRAGRPGLRDLPGNRPGRVRGAGRSGRRFPEVGPEHKVIMYIGSIVHPNQGVPILIDALPRIFAARPDARCVLVGGPAEAGERYRAGLGQYGDRLIVLCRPDARAGCRAVAPGRRAGPSPPGLSRELFGSEQDRGLPGGRPADRRDRFRRLSETARPVGAGVLTAVEPGPLADGILKVLNDPGWRRHWRRPAPRSPASISPWTATSTAISRSTAAPSPWVRGRLSRRSPGAPWADRFHEHAFHGLR